MESPKESVVEFDILSITFDVILDEPQLITPANKTGDHT
jgi:hypothetical protein